MQSSTASPTAFLMGDVLKSCIHESYVVKSCGFSVSPGQKLVVACPGSWNAKMGCFCSSKVKSVERANLVADSRPPDIGRGS